MPDTLDGKRGRDNFIVHMIKENTMTLFAMFPNQWTPALYSGELGEEPVPVRLAGEKLVLFRAEGGVHALLDRCPHRGVALSLGKVKDGCLSCPFHGWEFRGDGSCAHIPFNPDAARERVRATALPTREAGGLIWVFTGLAAEGEPLVPEALTDPAFVTYQTSALWRAHWTRAMENMLDFPHLPFVHRWTIGLFVRPHMKRESRALITTESEPGGFLIVQQLDDRPPERSLRWRCPNAMILDTIPRGPVQRMHVWCVPVDASTTRMMLVSARDFGRYNPLLRLFDRVNRRILKEDQAVLESSDPPEVPDPRQEVNMPTDQPTLRFRAWYLKNIAGRPAAPSLEEPADEPRRAG